MKIKGAEEKLGEIISNGKNNVTTILTDIQNEFQVRKDIIAKPSVIDYEVSEKGVFPIVKEEKLVLTPHSEAHLWARTQIPSNYANKLLQLEEYNLLHKNLTTMTKRQSADGILFRRVGNIAKGILSPSYRRMDASPIFESFVQTAINNKFVPYKGRNTNYRYQIQFIYPEIFQPAPSEYVVYGISMTTGDYGGQALELELLALRISCTNLSVGYDMFRKVHLGKRFNLGEGEDIVTLSDTTHQLDSQTVASAVADVTKSAIVQIEHVNKVVKSAVSKEVDIQAAITELRRKGMSKEIADRVKLTYETPAPVELLPQQNGLWRLSNAISLVAQGIEEADKVVNMEKLAMEVLLVA